MSLDELFMFEEAVATRVTLKDVAREARLSVAAVSKALSGHPQVSEATRKRAIRVSHKLNYVPRSRQAPVTRTAKRVGLVLVDVDRFAHYAMGWLAALTEAGDTHGLSIELISLPNERIGELDGVMAFGLLHPDQLAVIQSFDKPFVLVGDLGLDIPQEAPVHLVNSDTMRMGQAAAERMLKAGHRRIGFFCGKPGRGDWNDRWMTGFRLALMLAGVEDDAECRPIFSNCLRDEVGTEAAAHFSQMPLPPTAYVTPTVRAASRFMEAMARLGAPVAPDRIIMGGREQEREDYGLHAVTLIAEPSAHMAERAAMLLDALIGTTSPLTPARVVLPHRVLPAVLPDGQGSSHIGT